MQKTHLRTYANHVRHALVNRREALQTELAVMFAVIHESDSNKRLARESIYAVWNATGSYQCDQPTARDWKAVGRVINAAFALWDFVGEEEATQWAEGRKHGDLVAAFAERIAAYKLATVNEVLTICEKVRKPSTPRGPRGEAPVPAGSYEVRTEHMHLVVPPNVGADELMTVINALMKYANTLLDQGKRVTERERKAA
jgi:hypothetical protein